MPFKRKTLKNQKELQKKTKQKTEKKILTRRKSILFFFAFFLKKKITFPPHPPHPLRHFFYLPPLPLSFSSIK